MNGLKLNKTMAEMFFTGDFGKVYKRKLIESLLQTMNESNAGEIELSNSFFDENTMDFDSNDVEIVITCKLRKIAEN